MMSSSGAAAAAAAAPMTAAEYSEQVQDWLWQAHQWHIIALGFPSYLAYQASLQAQQGRPGQPASSPQQSQTQPRQQQQQAPAQGEFREFLVPPMWKRFVAEAIDFFTLFFLKLIITLIAVDSFHLFDIDSFMAKYDSSLLSLASGEELDLTTAMEMTSDIIMLEMVHRLVVCVFEAICTFRGPFGQPGGATPGKLAMGLRIFKCDEMVGTGHPNRVRISPAADLGFFWASIRAILKSMSLAFLFPVCILFMFLPYNRTIYDVMSKSIVVELEPRQARPARRDNNR